MKLLFLISLLFLFSFDSSSQEHAILIENSDGNIQLITECSPSFSMKLQKEWLQQLPGTGEITYCNSNQKKIFYKGSCLIDVSKKPSAFQIKMFYTIEIQPSKIQCKNIYYESLPSYEKQGSPAVISYARDWFAKDKYYKKSGKAKWMNEILKKNTMTKAKEILASAVDFY